MDIFKSYVVFSRRCTLKKIDVTKKNLRVIKRDNLEEILQEDCNNLEEIFTEEQIDEIANKLYEYMFVDKEVKEKHIKDIKEKYINK